MSSVVAEVQLARLLLGRPLLYSLNAYRMHDALWRAFAPAEPGTVRPFLYRADTSVMGDSGRAVLEVLVQSPRPGNWSVLEDLVDASQAMRSWRLEEGRRLRFLLRANPTRRDPEVGHRRRELRTVEERRGWLERKGQQHGFSVETYNERRRLQVRWKAGERQGGHDGVDFEGVLRVREPGLLKLGLERGIGAGKNWGFGLLSLASHEPW